MGAGLGVVVGGIGRGQLGEDGGEIGWGGSGVVNLTNLT